MDDSEHSSAGPPSVGPPDAPAGAEHRQRLSPALAMHIWGWLLASGFILALGVAATIPEKDCQPNWDPTAPSDPSEFYMALASLGVVAVMAAFLPIARARKGRAGQVSTWVLVLSTAAALAVACMAWVWSALHVVCLG